VIAPESGAVERMTAYLLPSSISPAARPPRRGRSALVVQRLDGDEFEENSVDGVKRMYSSPKPEGHERFEEGEVPEMGDACRKARRTPSGTVSCLFRHG
jgi:hypothetical protein